MNTPWVDGKGRTFSRLAALGRLKPGVIIDITLEGGTRVELLIGDINTLGGICDDCPGVRPDTIINRYRRVDLMEPDND